MQKTDWVFMRTIALGYVGTFLNILVVLALLAVVAGSLRHGDTVFTRTLFVAFVMTLVFILAGAFRIVIVADVTRFGLRIEKDEQTKHGELCWRQILFLGNQNTKPVVLPEIVRDGLLYAAWRQRECFNEDPKSIEAATLFRQVPAIKQFFLDAGNPGADTMLLLFKEK